MKNNMPLFHPVSLVLSCSSNAYSNIQKNLKSFLSLTLIIFFALYGIAFCQCPFSGGGGSGGGGCPFGNGKADGMCPLPKEYYVKMDEEKKTNADPGCRMGLSLSDKNVPEVKNTSIKASFVVDEDAKKTYSFIAHGEGTAKTPDEMKDNGDSDNTTSKDYLKWQPVDTTYHKHEQDAHQGCGCKFSEDRECYTWNGPDKEDGVKWGNGCQGWQVNTQAYAYHFDSPTLYGDTGQIGDNDSGDNKETDKPDDPKASYDFRYYVPSVPLWYSITSGLAYTWDWKGQWTHGYDVHHKGTDMGADGHKNPGHKKNVTSANCACPTVMGKKVHGGDGICDLCGHSVGEEKPQWTDAKNPDADTTNWDASSFYPPAKKIQKPEVAEKRKGTKESGYDEKGIVGTVYSDKQTFRVADKPAIIARATVRVKDYGNIAHVQTGLKSGNDKIMQTECGKKYIEPAEENITIRFVDNAPHATLDTIGKEGGEECVASDGDWKNKQFKATFWYETPLYQYTSYIADTWTDPEGKEHEIVQMVYSPMFVWKKGKEWTSLYAFLKDGGAGSSKVYGKDGNLCQEPTCPNPTVIVYENTFKASYLLKGEGASEIEMAPWHYAKTSLGDAFGTPPYDAEVKNDLFGKFEYKDSKGRTVAFPGNEIKFKFEPVNFTKGKGPLKYFFEVRDGSTLTRGGGKEEENFICENKHFIADAYTQGQLYFNPKKIKYLYKSDAADVLSPPGSYDPTAPVESSYCLSETYDKEGDPLQSQWKKCQGVRPVLYNNGDGDKIRDRFQTWGMIEITDKIRPNVGLRVADTTKGTVRRIFKINDNRTLKCYADLVSKPGSQWAVVEQGEKYNYILPRDAVAPHKPFSLNGDDEKLWEFNDLGDLTSSNSDSRIWEGKDYKDSEDSMMPYGTAEDTKLEMTHQDLRNSEGRADFVSYFANDNIDGQRVMDKGQQVNFTNTAADRYWYKGVTAFDFNTDEKNLASGTKKPSYPGNYINKGFTSWIIKDETYPDYENNPVFQQVYKNGEYFTYPQVTFNNPNCKWTGEDLPDGKKEISVAYGVRDREGNVRKFKLFFYTGPLDMKINTLERKEQRTE